MKPPFCRSAYNYDRELVSKETGEDGGDEPTLTQQNFADECDINAIVRRFGVTGQLPENVRKPTYGDFTSIGDFQTAMNAILEAESAFMRMPAEVRAEFDNDPHRFVAFCSDPANAERAAKLGLVDAAPQPVVAQAAPAGPTATPAPAAASTPPASS